MTAPVLVDAGQVVPPSVESCNDQPTPVVEMLLAEAQNESVALVEVVPLFKPLTLMALVVVAEQAAVVEPLLN